MFRKLHKVFVRDLEKYDRRRELVELYHSGRLSEEELRLVYENHYNEGILFADQSARRVIGD